VAVTRLAGFAVIVDCWPTALAGGVAVALSDDLALSSFLLANERRVVTDALFLLDPVMVVVFPLGVLFPSFVIVVVVVAPVVLFELIFSSWLFADFNKESTVGCCCCLDDELGVVCVAGIGVFCGVIGQLLEPSLLLGVIIGDTAEGRFLFRTGVTKSLSMVGWFFSKTGLLEDFGVFGSGVLALIDAFSFSFDDLSSGCLSVVPDPFGTLGVVDEGVVAFAFSSAFLASFSLRFSSDSFFFASLRSSLRWAARIFN